MQHKRILGALALVLSLCFISSAMVIDNNESGQEIVLSAPEPSMESDHYYSYIICIGDVEHRYADIHYVAYTNDTILDGVLSIDEYNSLVNQGYVFEYRIGSKTGSSIDFHTAENLGYYGYSEIYVIASLPPGTLSDDGTRLIQAPSNATEFTIPEGVNTVAGYAFFKCNDLKSITFPESVKTLEPHTFDGLGQDITVNIPRSATYMDQIPPFFNIVRTGIERTYPAPTADNYNANSKFEIHTPDELKTFALASNISGNTYEGKTVYLVNNLDMTNVSMGSIGGRSDSQFKGTFDGQGHVISNLEISMEGGLFYYIGTGGLVKNLGLYNCYMRGEGLQNSVFASENYGTIRNCYANACSVSWGGIDSGGAGFVCSNYGSIENCYSNTSCLKDYNTLCADNNGTVTNSYYLRGSWQPNKIGVAKTAEEMKDPNFATLLGNAYAPDTENVNNGYPVFAPISTEFTVSFETNGGSEVTSQIVKEGENAVRPADPTKQGYVFGGWHVDAALTNEYTFTTPVTVDITLYAKWYENLVFTSVPSISDIKITIDGRTISASVAADHYLYILWDLGNGETIKTYSNKLSYTYADDGEYIIKATAINSEGSSETVEYNVNIENNKEQELQSLFIALILFAVILIVAFILIFYITSMFIVSTIISPIIAIVIVSVLWFLGAL